MGAGLLERAHKVFVTKVARIKMWKANMEQKIKGLKYVYKLRL